MAIAKAGAARDGSGEAGRGAGGRRKWWWLAMAAARRPRVSVADGCSRGAQHAAANHKGDQP